MPDASETLHLQKSSGMCNTGYTGNSYRRFDLRVTDRLFSVSTGLLCPPRGSLTPERARGAAARPREGPEPDLHLPLSVGNRAAPAPPAAEPPVCPGAGSAPRPLRSPGEAAAARGAGRDPTAPGAPGKRLSLLPAAGRAAVARHSRPRPPQRQARPGQ